jgi:molybdopterin/thiamine biosynthesis adenylyltransferase
MRSLFHHEEIYRGEVLKKFSEKHITICGAGALGSNLIDNLTRQGFARLRAIDMDRVEQHNINTQIYNRSHIGSLKAQVIKTLVFQAVGIEIETEYVELKQGNIKKLLRKTDLVVDCFDNVASRQLVTDYCAHNKLSCLHLGLYEDYSEVIWNEKYKVPIAQKDSVDTCDQPLARNIILLATAVATEEIINFILDKERSSYYITLKDLKIKKE